MGCCETLENRLEHDERLLAGQRPELVEHIAEVSAGDVFHGEIDEPRGGALVVDGDNMGVGEARRRLRLPMEPRDEVWVLGEVAMHDLQRNCSIEAKVKGLINGSHATPSKEREHLITPVDRLTDECLLRRRHHSGDLRSQVRPRAAATHGRLLPSVPRRPRLLWRAWFRHRRRAR